MANLGAWLEENIANLVEVAVARLSQDAALKSQAVESVEIFFDGFIQTLVSQNPTPLNVILIDWVEARSAPSSSELTSVVPVLATLKEVTWAQILERCPPEQAVQLLVQADAIFTDALIYLSNLEGDSLLDDMRRQLQKAQSHVKRLDKSKSNFIAVAAHELRTPLTLVEGYADMLGSSPAVGSDAQIPLLLEGIDSGTKRLREIINDLIDVSLLDLKLMELHFQPVWLQHVLTAAERNISKMLSTRHVEVIMERDTIASQPTFADPDRLLQVLQKVLMNAVKYTPDGGKVIIRGREFPGFCDVMVIDNGIGISPLNLPHIFDTFSALGDASLHSSGKTKFKGGGPGLGLPIAKGIIEAHGGTVWAESDGYDEKNYPGSTFHIMIPMYSTPPDKPIWNIEKDLESDDSIN
ncbi:MAG: HAMP domain-containing histidine kinase [Anaerolineae bacterium]|nr:HAMP domain-containing histidine kinase [Anaerolineae bacterium]